MSGTSQPASQQQRPGRSGPARPGWAGLDWGVGVGPSPEVVRGRVPRWLQVGGVPLLGGEPTVNRTVRGLAAPGGKAHNPAGAGVGRELGQEKGEGW